MIFERIDFQTQRSRLLNREISLPEIAEEFAQRVRNDDYHAFLSILPERAFEAADAIQKKVNDGTAGKLAGMVMSVKDILSMKDVRTTAGSKILENYIPPYSATVIERLEAEDALILGKTNMDEFGMGSSNENSAYSPVQNPHDTERIPGGSSGGAAVSVASNMVMTALGSDTGGSVRQPAAHTGLVGLRPTYGRISRYGLIAFASSLDTIGILSHSARDCAQVLEVIAGDDSKDSTCSDKPVPTYTEFLDRDVKGLKIGVPEEYFGAGLSDDIREAIENVKDRLTGSGAILVPVTLPMTEYAIAAYYLVCTAEASSNLARFDGVKYGMSIGREDGLQSMYATTRHAGFGNEVKRRIMLGTYVLSAGYYDAYYGKAQKVRTLIRQDFQKAFESCDLILGPTTPTSAFKLGEKSDDPLSMYLSDIYTVSAPLAGIPAVSIPIGKDQHNLPIGMQLTGTAFAEETILNVADWMMSNQ